MVNKFGVHVGVGEVCAASGPARRETAIASISGRIATVRVRMTFDFEADHVSNGAALVNFLGSRASALSRSRTSWQVVSREWSPPRIVHASNVCSQTGFWFSPEREARQALVTETQRDVTGVVRLKLYKGNIIVGVAKAQRAFTIQRLRPWKATLQHRTKPTPPTLFD